MNTEAEAAAVVCGVVKRYSQGVIALNHCDLTIERARVTGLIGNNGSGKTTLLRILAGLVRPDSGRVEILGGDPSSRPFWLRARLGYISQSVELDPEMTGSETLRLFATLYGLPAANRRARMSDLARVFGLVDHLPRRVSTYSGGLRQRLHLALGLLHDPDLLLLDEPTAALDPPGRALVWQLLQRLRNEGRAVVVVTHDLAEASQHCQTIALLHEGRLLAADCPAEVIAAHAYWKLEVELTSHPEGNSCLLENLTTLPGVKQVKAHGRHLVAQLAQRELSKVQQTKETLCQKLTHLNIAVLGYRLHPPDLASAYFNLTGATIESAKQGMSDELGKGPGRRRRQTQEPIA